MARHGQDPATLRALADEFEDERGEAERVAADLRRQVDHAIRLGAVLQAEALRKMALRETRAAGDRKALARRLRSRATRSERS